jgi:hypothetical protein
MQGGKEMTEEIMVVDGRINFPRAIKQDQEVVTANKIPKLLFTD